MTEKDAPQHDELELEPEMVADLELPAEQADNIRGGKCQGNVHGKDATTLPSGTVN